MRKTWHWFLAMTLLCFITAACTMSPTAAGTISQSATANPILIATVQADQYWRDAAATTQAYQTTVEANYHNLQGTAQASTSTAITQAQQATATTQAQQTREALSLALTADSATAQARETAVALARQNGEATNTAVALATQNAFTATQQAFALQQAEAEAQREQLITIASYILLFVIIVVIVALICWLIWQLIPVLIHRASLVRYGQHSNPLLLLNRGDNTIITDPLRMLQAALTIEANGNITMPEITPNDVQTLVTGGVLNTLIEQAQHAPGHAPQLPTETIHQRRLGPVTTIETHRYAQAQQTSSEPDFGHDREEGEYVLPPPRPASWEILTANKREGLVLGMGQQDIVQLNLAQTPHVLIAGSSGTGKTRRVLRPLIAQALARGILVLLLNESGADFSPFYDHPNAINIQGDAATYKQVLEAAMQEIHRRESILRTAQVSEWGRLPDPLQDGPPLLIVIDEVLSLALMMPPRDRKPFWGLLASYASRARKLSMGSVAALTDPTYRVLGDGLTWREQCLARITFRVAKAAVSRAVLDQSGAEGLEEGHFMAMLGAPELVTGIAANPSDEELKQYLDQHPPAPTRQPDWIQLAASNGSS